MANKVFNLTSAFEVKSIDEEHDSITIKGYANTTDLDRGGDVVLEEAWKKGGLDNYLKNPIILAYHDHSQPIGSMVDFDIDSKGLKVVAEISKAAGKVYDLVKQGILKTFSVGFRVKDGDYDQAKDIFTIKDLELHEISVVSIPMNQNSIFSVAKSFNDEAEYKGFLSGFQNKEKEIMTDKVDTKPQASGLDSDMIAKAVAEALAAQKAADKAEAEKAAAEEARKAEIVELGKSGAERLLADAEARFADSEKTFTEALDGLRAELKEKSDEISALRSSKMSFADKGTSGSMSAKEVDEAILLAKSLGRSVESTTLGKQLIEKAGANSHLQNMTEDWEAEFSTRLLNDMQDKLIVEPLFTTIAMSTPTMHMPINPEAGIAEWIAAADYVGGANNSGSGANSTGTAQQVTLTDTTLAAYKLASKEYLGYEEEEDSLIPLMPIVRDHVVRRMARSSDIALLRGDAGQTSGAGNWPFNGIVTLADDAAAEATSTPSVSGGDKVTVAMAQETRRALGRWGLDPSEVMYLVSQDAYFDLLEDPDFRTVDVVGSNATILKGQIGTILGSPVMVSDSFAAKANGAAAICAVNPRNFIVGNLRGMTVERDRDIEAQKNILVATRRFGFKQLTTTNGVGAAILKYSA